MLNDIEIIREAGAAVAEDEIRAIQDWKDYWQ
jgi:hypothetical protein